MAVPRGTSLPLEPRRRLIIKRRKELISEEGHGHIGPINDYSRRPNMTVNTWSTMFIGAIGVLSPELDALPPICTRCIPKDGGGLGLLQHGM